jgi:cell wall-associated NlpC family hydrolase
MTRARLPSFVSIAGATGLFWLVLAAGCATGSASRRDLRAANEREVRGGSERSVEQVLRTARATVVEGGGEVDGRPIPRDCSGYVRAIYRRAGLDLFTEGQSTDNGVRAIARFVGRHGRWHHRMVPSPGDLVFFDNSYDRNGDGRLNDRFTHVGIVERVSADGTAMIIHASNHGIVREPMNLLRPHATTDEQGQPINTFLRRRGPHDSPRTPHLMSELFAGFATVLPPVPSGA